MILILFISVLTDRDTLFPIPFLTQSAWVVEYVDCITAEGLDLHNKWHKAL